MKTLKSILALNIIVTAIQLVCLIKTPVHNEAEGWGVAIVIVLDLLYIWANIFAWRKLCWLQLGFCFVSESYDSLLAATNAYKASQESSRKYALKN